MARQLVHEAGLDMKKANEVHILRWYQTQDRCAYGWLQKDGLDSDMVISTEIGRIGDYVNTATEIAVYRYPWEDAWQ